MKFNQIISDNKVTAYGFPAILLQRPIERNNMKKITLLNTSIITSPGDYQMSGPFDAKVARDIIAQYDTVESAIGHQSTADILTTLLGVPVALNRAQYAQQEKDTALVFKLRCRYEEGKTLTIEEIEAIGYDFYTLKMKY